MTAPEEVPEQRISFMGAEDIVYEGPGKLESFQWDSSGRLTLTITGYRPGGAAEPRGVWPL